MFLSIVLIVYSSMNRGILYFRPRIGDYFLSVEYLKDLRKKNAIVFPSPYWGLFFIRCLPYTVVCLLGLSFRPRTGDYFLSKDAMIHMGIDFVHEFPSPYWGLFFIGFMV